LHFLLENTVNTNGIIVLYPKTSAFKEIHSFLIQKKLKMDVIKHEDCSLQNYNEEDEYNKEKSITRFRKKW